MMIVTADSAAERAYARLMEDYGERIALARQQLAKAWRHENHDRPAVILSDVNYALCGQNDIPENYFKPPVMFHYQMDKILAHMQNIRDDYVPVLHPWYGTTVVPSALGVAVCNHKGMDPSLGSPVLREPEDIVRLRKPDPETDGQMPLVLACIDYMKEHTDVPVCITDCQGPLNIALSLAGVENLFIWMYEEPEAVHQLMQFCTDVLIDWVRLQKKHAGHMTIGDAYPHAIEIPEGYGGVAFSDDDVTTIGTVQYQSFVASYNEQLLEAFGGGSMHFCGSARHQLDAVSGMRGIRAVNNFCMGDFEQIRLLQEKMRGCGAVMACDFNAEDIRWHTENLKKLAWHPEGLVLGVFFAPSMALLRSGKYAAFARNTQQLVEQYACVLDEAGILPVYE